MSVVYPNASIFVATGKIYDITHADANEHSVALPAGYPANTKALVVMGNRTAGTGQFHCRSVSGEAASRWELEQNQTGIWQRAADGLFYYALTVANDVWDIYAVGYLTGPPPP